MQARYHDIHRSLARREPNVWSHFDDTDAANRRYSEGADYLDDYSSLGPQAGDNLLGYPSLHERFPSSVSYPPGGGGGAGGGGADRGGRGRQKYRTQQQQQRLPQETTSSSDG